jgi:hypothetical protein
VTVSRLPANSAGYDVYVYADGDNAATRTGTYQISGALDHDDECEPDGCCGHGLQRDIYAGSSNGNYVKFTITAAGSGNGRESAGTSECHPDRAAGEASQADSSSAVRVIRAGVKTASSLRTRHFRKRHGVRFRAYVLPVECRKCGFRLTRFPPTVPCPCHSCLGALQILDKLPMEP